MLNVRNVLTILKVLNSLNILKITIILPTCIQHASHFPHPQGVKCDPRPASDQVQEICDLRPATRSSPQQLRDIPSDASGKSATCDLRPGGMENMILASFPENLRPATPKVFSLEPTEIM